MSTSGKLEKVTPPVPTPVLYGPPQSSGLTMSNATYARSAKGRKTLTETTLIDDINKITKAINGSNYQNVIKAINNNWVGADAEDFKKKIDATRKNILTGITTLQKKFATAINSEAKEFASFQSNNKVTRH